MITQDEAVAISRKHLAQKGIRTFDVKTIRKIDGSVRAEVLPEKRSDFWMVTFDRSTELVADTKNLTKEQIELLNSVALENDTITVRVEMSGDVEVI